MIRRLVSVGITALAAYVAIAWPAPSSAQTTAVPELLATGWWTDMLTTSTSENSTAVGESPDGTRTVAALRIQAANGLTSAFVDLVETATTASGVGGVVACVGPNNWQPVEGGDLESAPRSDCEDAEIAPVVRDAPTATWSVNLTDLLRGHTGEVTVVLVPDAERDPSGLGGFVPWTVEWAGPPTFTAQAAVSATTTTTAPSPAPSTPPRPTTASFTPPPIAAPPRTVVTTTTTLPILASVPTTTTLPPATVGVSEGFAAAQPILGDDGSDDGRPIAQAVFMLVLAAVVGTAAGAGHWWVTGRR